MINVYTLFVSMETLPIKHESHLCVDCPSKFFSAACPSPHRGAPSAMGSLLPPEAGEQETPTGT